MTPKFYQIVSSLYMWQLTSICEELMQQGWYPAGGVVLDQDDQGRTSYFQTMYMTPVSYIPYKVDNVERAETAALEG